MSATFTSSDTHFQIVMFYESSLVRLLWPGEKLPSHEEKWEICRIVRIPVDEYGLWGRMIQATDTASAADGTDRPLTGLIEMLIEHVLESESD